MLSCDVRNFFLRTETRKIVEDPFTWKIHIKALLNKNDVWTYGWIATVKLSPILFFGVLFIRVKAIQGLRVWSKLEAIYASKGPARKATLLK